jgi:hypothetical protein
MTNPLTEFVSKGRNLTDLGGSAMPVPDDKLRDFIVNRKRLEFLKDLIERVSVVAYCYDSILSLTDRWKSTRERMNSAPSHPKNPGIRPIPLELIEEQEGLLIEADIFTSLIYYEVVSIVDMLRQMDVCIEPQSELHYLVKIRDRFLSHNRLNGVIRSAYRGLSVPEHGPLQRDMFSLNAWSSEDLRALGDRALNIGSPSWIELRKKNEKLILSSKRNDQFSRDEIVDLMAAGARECQLELALLQLSRMLDSELIPIIIQETKIAIENYEWER